MPQSPINNTTTSFNVPVEKLFEQAEETGVLVLTGRKLSIFPPTVSSFDLTDVTVVDLSANRFVVLPQAIAEMVSVERLCCYNNVMRTLPPLGKLQSLVSLNVSRNHLATLPAHTCSLPLKELNVSHNRLVSLPDELGQLKALMDLDISGNELAVLPACIGELSNLRDLNVRRNHLQNLPDALTGLSLVRLDISVNRVSRLPLSFIKMQTLRFLVLHDNPMVLPPTNVCLRGRVHIMKYLQAELEQTNSKDDISVRSSRAAARRENRANHARRTREREPGSPRSTSSMPMSLEAEMEHVAKQHGLDWSAGGGSGRPGPSNLQSPGPNRKPNVIIHNAGMVASSTTVSAGGIIPKPSDPDRTLEDDDDSDLETTPVSSPQPRTSTPNAVDQRFFDATAMVADGGGSVASPVPAAGAAVPPAVTSAAGSKDDKRLSAQEVARAISPRHSPARRPMSQPQMARLVAEEQPETRQRSFTVQRKERRTIEQTSTVDSLRSLLEGTLGYNLPENLLASLCDGVVLCNLLNKLRPKTISVIYAPPRDGKLSQGKSFKNVDSFINGCLRVGIEDSMVCTTSDILQAQTPLHIFITVKALLTNFSEIEVSV